MAQRPYKVRKKISATMKGTSNFAGKEHSIGSKAKISDRRGHYDPIKDKKWFIHGDTYKTLRKTQNPGGLFRRGRTVKENQMKSFIEYVVENKAMVKKMSDEHPEARFRTNPLKPTMSMKDRMAQRKNLSNLLKKKMNEGRLKDIVTGHMDKGMSYDKAVKKAQKDLDKLNKPSDQMKLPMKSEQALDELSIDTLKSYEKKASDERDKAPSYNDPKARKRMKGIFQARSKINDKQFNRPRFSVEPKSRAGLKNEENIDELSTKTLKSYVDKAEDDVERRERTDYEGMGTLDRRRSITGANTRIKAKQMAKRKNFSTEENKMTPGQAAMKKLDSRPSNIALRNAIANVNRRAQDTINQRTKKAKADSKPR